MKKGLFLLMTALLSLGAMAQEPQVNGAGRIMQDLNDQKLVIGGYGQIDYNQPFGGDVRQNGKLDVHRVILLFGYQFNERTKLVTELEVEHVSEIYVEQAFINYEITPSLNFAGGLMLVPMGIVNEYHEPTTYNGVERPNVDKYIVPTTWREIGAGINGNISGANLKYQLYVMNGFKSYEDGAARLSGKYGVRKGRQKGAESFMSSPNLSAKIDYYGIHGLILGLAGYFGKTQSDLYDGLDTSDKVAEARADSSVVGIAMIGLDARYTMNKFHARGQLIYNSLSNTKKYNEFSRSDVGSKMLGAYGEVAYDFNLGETRLTPFVRMEHYNMQYKTDGFAANEAYKVNEVIAGVGYKVADGVVFKADLQWRKPKAKDDYDRIFNMGIGFWF